MIRKPVHYYIVSIHLTLNNRYYLSLCVDGSEEGIINRTCAVLTENGRRETPTYVKELFFAEHFDEIIADNAIEKLGQL